MNMIGAMRVHWRLPVLMIISLVIFGLRYWMQNQVPMHPFEVNPLISEEAHQKRKASPVGKAFANTSMKKVYSTTI
jgi:hypothetical protein